jgi:hypothetical protein
MIFKKVGLMHTWLEGNSGGVKYTDRRNLTPYQATEKWLLWPSYFSEIKVNSPVSQIKWALPTVWFKRPEQTDYMYTHTHTHIYIYIYIYIYSSRKMKSIV